MVQEDREYCKVLCRVPEYQQPQPEAQAYIWAKQGLASAPASQPDNPHLLNGRKAGTDVQDVYQQFSWSSN
jgi:hypothetical protein